MRDAKPYRKKSSQVSCTAATPTTCLQPSPEGVTRNARKRENATQSRRLRRRRRRCKSSAQAREDVSGWPGGRPKAVVRFSGTLHGRPEAYREKEEERRREEQEKEDKVVLGKVLRCQLHKLVP